jgi:hypothetical protein
MKTAQIMAWARGGLSAALFCAFSAGASLQARVLDNFDDGVKTGWEDFTFVEGFGIPQETGGELRFDLPPAGQPIFTAAQYKSEIFTLQDGRTVEFRVDVMKAGGGYSYPVLAFIPGSPAELAGYSLAQSTTDVLIAKGIQKYFIDDDTPTGHVKNENVTLVLRLTGRGGSVEITGQVLDKENDDAVLWERTFVDTPGEDVMDTGQDDPPAPYLTSGYFTLFCYENFDDAAPEPVYVAHFDNARVRVADTEVLDDFNDNTKTDWTDFTFVEGFGIPRETGGHFVFDLPPAGQDIFTASQKTSRLVELKEGERIEMRVDVVESSGEDAFAVLGFIPNTGNGPGALEGYSIAKDPTDVIIAKGIQKYFVADDSVAAELKNENITLALALEVKEGSVFITAQVLDKENDNAVLWERTVVDTPGEDPMADGTDSPAAPFITTGYVTLYCYQQFNDAIGTYRVGYDNLTLTHPPAGNTAPLIADFQPGNFANFVPADAALSFQVTDNTPLPKDKVTLTLNGETPDPDKVSVTNVDADGKVVKLTLTGGLEADQNYVAVLSAEDEEGLVATQTVYFDTFDPADRVIEVEDYNFFGGQFINDPVPYPEGWYNPTGSYNDQEGYPEVDFHDTRTAPSGGDTPYRTADPVRMQHSLDNVRQKYLDAGGADLMVFDYDVKDIAEGEWLQYTRNFTPGSYEVYLRQSIVNMSTAESVLERVTGDPTQADAATELLGSFLGVKTGFQYRNFLLTDATGQNPVVLRLSGQTTLRLRQVTGDPGDGGRYQNYLIFVRVPDAGKQRAAIVQIEPAPDAEAHTVEPVIWVEIQNRETSVQVDSIRLELNGSPVNAQVTATPNGAKVTYPLYPLPPSGAPQNARITYRDSENEELVTDWSFTVVYNSLDPATARTGPGLERGFNVRVVQAPEGTPLDNSLLRAEAQLAPDSDIPKYYETNIVDQVINYSQNGPGSSDGAFPDDARIPGLDPLLANGDDYLAMEVSGWLELTAGIHRFGVISDDGFKVTGGTLVNDPTVPVLSFRSGGTANQTFDFIVPKDGFYPFRFVWYEQAGGAHVEWFSVNRDTDERTLINSDAPGAIQAYVDVENHPVDVLEYTDTLGGPFVEAPDAVLADGAFRTAKGGTTRFYRIRSNVQRHIVDIQVTGEQVVIRFE